MFYLFLITGSVYQVVVRSFRPRADTLSFLDPPPFGSFCDHLFLSHSWRSFFSFRLFFFVFFLRILLLFIPSEISYFERQLYDRWIVLACGVTWPNVKEVEKNEMCLREKKNLFFTIDRTNDTPSKFWRIKRITISVSFPSYCGATKKIKVNDILPVAKLCNLLLLIISFCVINTDWLSVLFEKNKKLLQIVKCLNKNL